MAASVTQKRILLRLSWRTAQSKQQALLQALEAGFDAAAASIKDGSFVTSTGIGPAQMSQVTLRGMSPEDVADAYDALLADYATAVTNLGGSPTDESIFNEMSGLLTRVRECFSTGC